MSPSCAKACNIEYLIDERFSGIARGVGTAAILGRVHNAVIIIGNFPMDCSFTVMEGKDVDLMLGLDILKRHQMCIDLRKGALILQDQEVKFLGEADIPKNDHQALVDEPTIPGPAGLQTGAISGTVTKAAAADNPSSASKGKPSATAPIPGSSRAQPPSSTPSSFPADDIAKLMDMGFSREQAIQGLELAHGNVDTAVDFLS